jgi:hypothetical protein
VVRRPPIERLIADPTPSVDLWSGSVFRSEAESPTPSSQIFDLQSPLSTQGSPELSVPIIPRTASGIVLPCDADIIARLERSAVFKALSFVSLIKPFSISLPNAGFRSIQC